MSRYEQHGGREKSLPPLYFLIKCKNGTHVNYGITGNTVIMKKVLILTQQCVDINHTKKEERRKLVQ